MNTIKKLIKAQDYIDGALKLLKRKLEYNNHAPYNLGYCHADGHISGDCWCINPKVMVWSMSIGEPVWENRTPGKYYYADGISASGLPDWDGASILNAYCEDITFTKMLQEDIKPALLLNGDRTHMGAYIGEYTMDGKTYNVMEFTPAAAVGGTMRSYVDAQGRRWSHKGGTCFAAWARAGRMTGIINYDGSVQPEPTPKTKPYSIDNLAVHIMRGDFGNNPERTEKILALGYTDAEYQQAQGIVNQVYERYNRDKLASEVAMKFIAGEAGDGVTKRRQWVIDNYSTDELFRPAQEKVNEYLA